MTGRSVLEPAGFGEASPGPAAAVPYPVTLEAVRITRTFDGGRVCPLVDVDLSARRGEILSIVGSSGSGKTTLLNILGLLDRPDSGAVVVDGTVVDSSVDERRRARLRAQSIGFIFQDSLVDPRRTAAENVELALLFAGVPRAERARRALDALHAADVGDRAHVQAGDLSGGERQRVAVARAMAHGPAILLCDEPTGNLDERNTERVFGLLDDFARDGGTVVLVTHDLGLARRTARSVTVARGGISPC